MMPKGMLLVHLNAQINLDLVSLEGVLSGHTHLTSRFFLTPEHLPVLNTQFAKFVGVTASKGGPRQEPLC